MTKIPYDVPQEWLTWLIRDIGLSVKQAEQIVDTDIPHLYRYFEAAVIKPSPKWEYAVLINLIKPEEFEFLFKERVKITADFILGELARLANKSKTKIVNSKLTPESLSFIVLLFQLKMITAATAKYIIGKTWDTGESPMNIYANESLERIWKKEDLQTLIITLADTHAAKLDEYAKGNEKIGPMLIGHLMKTTKGCVDAELLTQELEYLLFYPEYYS